MARIALTDELWEQLQHTMKQHGFYITKNTRTVMEAILWKLRTGAPWRDIPEELISWKTAYNRFNRWSENGLWQNFFLAYEKKLIQHASGARLGFDRAIGQSHGGRTTKIHLCCDANGYPLDFKVTGGEVHDSQVAPELIELVGSAEYLIADKGYDSDTIRDKARQHKMKPVIPKRKNAKQPNPDFDSYLYKLRHLVENMFARLKQFRSIATRYEKLARNFESMIYLACTIIHAKVN